MDDLNKLLHIWAENAMRRSIWAFFRFNQERNLSTTQINSLFFICRHTSSSINDLAKHWGVTKAAASQIVDKLVEQGWIDRKENPNDRRSRNLTITPAGKELTEEARKFRHSWIDSFVASLNPEEIALVTPAFEVLNQKLSAYSDGFENPESKKARPCSD